jgi:hypothetical protein
MIIIFWIGLSMAVGAWASGRDRNGFGWFFLALLISPLLAGIFLLIAGQAGPPCPFCREHVRADAIVCKHCQRDLPRRAESQDTIGWA